MTQALSSVGRLASGRRAGRGVTAREREFRAARRHSALVRVLRWALPLSGAGAMGLFALSYLVRAQLPELDDVSFGVEAARLTQDGIVMDRPHITGTSAKGQRFEVRAAKAWGNPDNAKLINFEAIEAEVGLKEGGEAVVTAREGLYDSERETLTIAGDVRVRSTSGYGVEASRAFVDFRSGSLRTEEPLLLQTGEARIEASGAVVDGAERAAEFMGRVRMTITPGPETMQ